MSPLRRIIVGISVLTLILVFGIIGYIAIEGWSFMDALYMTVITVTTVGYFEVHPLDTAGRIFTIVLIIVGVGAALYTLTLAIEYILEGRFGFQLGRRNMKNRISSLKDHFILCGYGRVGNEIANVFKEENIPFIVIDREQKIVAEAEKDGCLVLQGDAADDAVLKEAGIERARGLVAAGGSDADNTYITLSARVLRPDLFIEARASSTEAEVKLKKAGATRIISPDKIGAQRMAMLALRPAVLDFIDTVTLRHGPELQLENLDIKDGSALEGLTVGKVRECARANVLAISRKTGKLLANPDGDETIKAGDRLIVMGTKEELSSLETTCEGVKLDEKT